MQSPGDSTSTVRGVQRHDHARPDRAAAATPRPPPGALDLSIRRRGAVIELGLAGDLDMATAPRLGEAMALARTIATAPRTAEALVSHGVSRDRAATIVIDTSNVQFIAAAGYRALQAALAGPDRPRAPRVSLIVGPAVARIEAAIAAASSRSARCRLRGEPGTDATIHPPRG